MVKMTIENFIKQDIDIDVCDDYDESIYIAFVGPVELTEAGRAEFNDILDMTVECPRIICGCIEDNIDIAILNCENDKEARRLYKFFYSAAGYCSAGNYDKWFTV